jgi:hypothetical protein
MSSDALQIYQEHQDEQFGENSPFTEMAVFDPDGLSIDIWGVFDDNTFRDGQGRGNFNPKRSGARFVISQMPVTGFDVYTDYQLSFPERSLLFKIEYAEKDKQGAQVLWLKPV